MRSSPKFVWSETGAPETTLTAHVHVLANDMVARQNTSLS